MLQLGQRVRIYHWSVQDSHTWLALDLQADPEDTSAHTYLGTDVGLLLKRTAWKIDEAEAKAYWEAEEAEGHPRKRKRVLCAALVGTVDALGVARPADLVPLYFDFSHLSFRGEGGRDLRRGSVIWIGDRAYTRPL